MQMEGPQNVFSSIERHTKRLFFAQNSHYFKKRDTVFTFLHAASAVFYSFGEEKCADEDAQKGAALLKM